MASYTTITASGITDLSGEILASGKVRMFGPVNQNGKLVSATAAGAPIACTEAEFIVSGGAITTRSDGSAARVIDTSTTLPENICYRVRILDDEDNEVQGPGYEAVQPSGSTWALRPSPQPDLGDDYCHQF